MKFVSAKIKFSMLVTVMGFGSMAQAVLPTFPVGGSWKSPISTVTDLFRFDDDLYRIGDEYGKKPVTEDDLTRENPVFNRAARATANVYGATAFYLGKFNGYYVMATNHHVFPTEGACLRSPVRFKYLSNLSLRCTKYFGTWTAIDLSLFAVKPNNDEEAAALESVKGNFAFRGELTRGQDLLTIGYGIAFNPGHNMMANQNKDCKVFSDKNEFRFMGDPDTINPGAYKAWSFATGCSVSHGDSGSAIVDRKSGDVVGIIWTGAFPKEERVKSSEYLAELLQKPNEDIWNQLSYAVPAQKMAEVLKTVAESEATPKETRETLVELLK